VLEGELDNSMIPNSSPPVDRISNARRLPVLIATWAQKAQELQKEAHVFYFAFKHPRTPWYARLIAACAAAYLLSPIQIIPSFIPIIGFMDDLVVLVVGFKLVKRAISPEVLQECRDHAEAAEVRRRAEVTPMTTVVLSTAIAILWLILGIAGSLLVANHFRHK
jgi:uncharacterized membrane protein YkvA (DUF1232 family)